MLSRKILKLEKRCHANKRAMVAHARIACDAWVPCFRDLRCSQLVEGALRFWSGRTSPSRSGASAAPGVPARARTSPLAARKVSPGGRGHRAGHE